MLCVTPEAAVPGRINLRQLDPADLFRQVQTANSEQRSMGKRQQCGDPMNQIPFQRLPLPLTLNAMRRRAARMFPFLVCLAAALILAGCRS